MCPPTSGARGVGLVELIVFIAVVGVAVAGVLGVITITSRASAEPMAHKQALAIAEAVLEEVQLQPFTYCDPDDANAATATSAAVSATGCAATPETIGVEGLETRSGNPVGSPPFFDNVSDYNLYNSTTATPSGITDFAGSAITGLSAYSVVVAIAAEPLSGVGNDANGRPQSLRITVTVTGPGGITTTLDGYRVRYAPNAF